VGWLSKGGGTEDLSFRRTILFQHWRNGGVI